MLVSVCAIVTLGRPFRALVLELIVSQGVALGWDISPRWGSGTRRMLRWDCRKQMLRFGFGIDVSRNVAHGLKMPPRRGTLPQPRATPWDRN